MNNKVKKKKMMMKGEEMKERHRRSGWGFGSRSYKMRCLLAR